MKIKEIILSGLLLSGLVLGACNKSDDNDQLNDQDQDFLVRASISNNAEISAGTLASTKATNARVKAFAQQMVAEHTMAQNDLKTVGSSAGYAVKDTIDPAHVALAAQLNAMSGRAFDSAYMYSQVTDHQNTVTLFQTELTGGREQNVLNYANTYLPHIQMHYQVADSVSKAYFKR